MKHNLSVRYRLAIFLRSWFALSLAAPIFLETVLSSNIWASPGDLYVSESSNLFIGDSIQHFHPDGSKEANLASDLKLARGLAFDKAGNLFAVESNGGSILKFAPDGTRSTFATIESVSYLTALTFDDVGNLYVAYSKPEFGIIFRFTPGGIRSIFALGLDAPTGMTFSASGDLFVCQSGFSGNVLRITPDGSRTVFASSLIGPRGIAFDRDGNLFVTEQIGRDILEFTPAGEKSVFANLIQPIDIAFDSFGNLFASEYYIGLMNDGGFIYKYTPNGERSIFASNLDPQSFAFEPVP